MDVKIIKKINFLEENCIAFSQEPRLENIQSWNWKK